MQRAAIGFLGLHKEGVRRLHRGWVFSVVVYTQWSCDGGGVFGFLHFEGSVEVPAIVAVVVFLGSGATDFLSCIERDKFLPGSEVVTEELDPGWED